MNVSGYALAAVDKDLIARLNLVVPRIAAKDYTVWGQNTEAQNRINWLDLPISSRSLLPELDALSAWARSLSLTHIVLCGMGGSSLASEVIAKSNNKNLTIIDSTDPDQILSCLPKDLDSSLIVFSSKSGTTIETLSQFKFFKKLFLDNQLDPLQHMVIITDPGTTLDESSRKSGFKVFNADPNVGGRFSALTTFGLLPASLIGVDVSVLLDDADNANQMIAKANSPAVLIAAALFSNSEQIVNFVSHGTKLPGLCDWIEQLIAESTGKEGKGRLPVVFEKAQKKAASISVGFGDGDYDLSVEATLGEHFILWQWVTALLCYLLEVDPFNQPNVTESKDRTTNILLKIIDGVYESPKPIWETDDLALYSNRNVKNLSEFLSSSYGYLAIMAFLPQDDFNNVPDLQRLIFLRTGIPTTFGWGPRFLHSTGQIHKGGQQNGGFIQITRKIENDLDIPDEKFTFGELISAQALGDEQALVERGLPLIRVHLKNREFNILKVLG
jgi:glucose-6-phosphate isomerase